MDELHLIKEKLNWMGDDQTNRPGGGDRPREHQIRGHAAKKRHHDE
jgi:hypothetical protein